MRSADDETAGRVDEDLCIFVDHACRNDRVDDVPADIRMNLLLRHIRVMLGRDDDRLEARRPALLVVLDGDLGLAVRTKVGQCAVLADLRELQCQLLGQRDRVRHVLRGLVRGVAEHHALVARADGFELLVGHFIFLRFEGLIDAHRDIRGLLVHRHDHRAGLRVEAHGCVRVADPADRVARDLLEIKVRLRRDLAHDEAQPGRHGRLAGDAAHRVLREAGVQHRVRDRVADFIRMSLCH